MRSDKYDCIMDSDDMVVYWYILCIYGYANVALSIMWPHYNIDYGIGDTAMLSVGSCDPTIILIVV